ncbi:MAG: 30S ribosomal protein S18 [Mycoplasmataceae bacterium]|jgi:small subunit ribosomal protein S18|nr:30S ribosomal protein S18 [Mycoplasmataceae bacterium]
MENNNQQKKYFDFQPKSCLCCKKGVLHIDHKDVELLNTFISYNGKIKPRRISGACCKHQRMIQNAIKRARLIALIPFVKG